MNGLNHIFDTQAGCQSHDVSLPQMIRYKQLRMSQAATQSSPDKLPRTNQYVMRKKQIEMENETLKRLPDLNLHAIPLHYLFSVFFELQCLRSVV